MAQNISRAATFGQSWDGHNLVILRPIWTLDPLKWSARRDKSIGEKI